jgi:hypothetical protein
MYAITTFKRPGGGQGGEQEGEEGDTPANNDSLSTLL